MTEDADRFVIATPSTRRLGDASQPDGRIRQRFEIEGGHAIYGLGQHQAGPLDYRGTTVRLPKANTDVGVPVLVSSAGYGVFWTRRAFPIPRGCPTRYPAGTCTGSCRPGRAFTGARCATYGPRSGNAGNMPTSRRGRRPNCAFAADEDDRFTLYDDAGDGRGWRRSERATIDVTLDDKTGTLTIGARQGRYPGMPAARIFHVVSVGMGNGLGLAEGTGRTIACTGQAVSVALDAGDPGPARRR